MFGTNKYVANMFVIVECCGGRRVVRAVDCHADALRNVAVN